MKRVDAVRLLAPCRDPHRDRIRTKTLLRRTRSLGRRRRRWLGEALQLVVNAIDQLTNFVEHSFGRTLSKLRDGDADRLQHLQIFGFREHTT